MYNSKSFRELGKKTISKAKQNLAYKKVLNIYDILNVINPLLKEKNYTLSGQTLNLGLVNGD